MALRKLQETDLCGKTIESIDSTILNILIINFNDGTHVKLWAEDGVYTPYGSIPGIFIEDPSI